MLRNTYVIATAILLSAALANVWGGELSVVVQPSPTEAAVRKVVEQHIQGIVDADIKLLEAAWDTKAGRIAFVTTNGEGQSIAHSAPIGESLALWTARKYPNSQGKIQSIEVVNDQMAFVRAQITWKRQQFDDFLVLLNTDHGWKLVSKTYSTSGGGSGGYGVGLKAP